jgi:hypothetical protein
MLFGGHSPTKDDKEGAGDRKEEEESKDDPGSREDMQQKEKGETATLIELRRSSIAKKGWVTRATAELAVVLAEEDTDQEGILEAIERVQHHLKGLVDVQERIGNLLPDEELEQHIVLGQCGVTDLANKGIRAAKRKIKQLKLGGRQLQEHQGQLPGEQQERGGAQLLGGEEDDHVSLASGPCGSCAQSHSGGGGRVKLPKLELDKFTGDPLEWPAWWSQFRALVDSQFSISQVEKRMFLGRYVVGEASRAIKAVPISDKGYKLAVDILEDTYGRPKVIRDSLYRQLKGINAACDPWDTKGVRALLDEVTLIVARLQEVGVTEVELGGWLVAVVEPKLPGDYLMEWSRNQKDGDGDAKGMLEFMRHELKFRERAKAAGAGGSQVEKKKTEKYVSSPATASALSAQQGPRNRNTPQKRCVLCMKGGHYGRDCMNPISEDELQRKIQASRACWRCATVGHTRARCRASIQCKKCTANSHITAAHGHAPYGEQNNPPYQTGEASGGATAMSAATKVNGTAFIILKTVAVAVTDEGKRPVRARALLDTGCSHTLVSRELVKQVKPKVVGVKTMKISAFGGGSFSGRFQIVQFRAFGDGKGVLDFEAVVVDQLPVTMAVATEVMRNELEVELGAENLAAYSDSRQVEIIFGEDLYDEVTTGVHRTLASGTKATATIFGWIAHGPSTHQEEGALSSVAHVFKACSSGELDRFYDLEHLGISTKEEEEQDVLKNLVESIEIDEEGRRTVGLIWKPGGREQLTANRGVAVKRLEAMTRRLNEDETERYRGAMEEMISNEFAEEVPDGPPQGPVSYLPHRPVFKNTSTTTKTRPVHDASAKEKGGRSLNECLETGPSLLPVIFGVLLRFRTGKHAICGDLTKAFMQIKIKAADRDALRFLWDNKEYRMCRVLFGMTSSPFILQAVIKHLLDNSDCHRETASALAKAIYVDDLVKSLHDGRSAKAFWEDAKAIFKEGGFTLCKLKTSSREFGETDDGVQEVKVLGIPWDVGQDELIVTKNAEAVSEEGQGRLTRRKAVGALARIYDPLGMAAPLYTELKVFIQSLWLDGGGWDTPIEELQEQRFRKILHRVTEATGVRVPRWLAYEPGQATELHVFVDASANVYAAVAYLRTEATETICHLIASKNRVKPKGGMTIPRMELMAALLGSRLATCLLEELESAIGRVAVTIWSDAMTVLRWIAQQRLGSSVFVNNRLKEIHANTEVEWRWVPTDQNPADLPTRGTTGAALARSDLWWKGPEFLAGAKETWPVAKLTSGEGEDVAFVCAEEPPLEESLEEELQTFVDPPRTSQFTRTRNSLIWMRRWRLGVRSPEQEKREAEELIWKKVQEQLIDQKEVKGLNVYTDDRGLIRMGGRLDNVPAFTEEARHPVLLRRCGVVEQYIREVHQQEAHCGTGMMISLLRARGLWVLSGKKTISSVIRKCQVCSRYNAGRGEEITPPFPRCRTVFTRAFNVTGVDLGGPMYLDDGSKVWFALFTCMATRAVHLELVRGLSVEDMERALCRFTARRGWPEKLMSDHGTNFVGLAKRIEVKWEYMVENGPWWGGTWERLIGVTKGLLRRTLGKQRLSWERLDTVMKKVERMINLRPVTHQWSGAERGAVPLPVYPELFLFPPGNSLHEHDLNLEWETQVKALWEREYLTGVLGAKGEGWRRADGGRRVKMGDVVLIEGPGRRGSWKLGLVTNLIPGVDGRPRVALLKTATGALRRPVQRLYPLEVEGPSCPLPTGAAEAAGTGTVHVHPDSNGGAVDVEAGDEDGGAYGGAPVEETTTRVGRVVRLPTRFRRGR